MCAYTFFARTEGQFPNKRYQYFNLTPSFLLCFYTVTGYSVVWTGGKARGYRLVLCYRQVYWGFVSTAVNDALLFSSYKDSRSVKLDSPLTLCTRESLLSLLHAVWSGISVAWVLDLNMFLCLTKLQNIRHARMFC
jgi:hypothetical protein